MWFCPTIQDFSSPHAGLPCKPQWLNNCAESQRGLSTLSLSLCSSLSKAGSAELLLSVTQAADGAQRLIPSSSSPTNETPVQSCT